MPRKEARREVKQVRSIKRKGIKAQRVKPPISVWAIDAFIGDEEQNGKKENNKNKQKMNFQPNYPGIFGYLLEPVWIIPILLPPPLSPQDGYVAWMGHTLGASGMPGWEPQTCPEAAGRILLGVLGWGGCLGSIFG